MQLSYSIEEISSLTGIGRTKIYEAINSGSLKAKKYGRRTIVLKKDIDAFLLSLKAYEKTAS